MSAHIERRALITGASSGIGRSTALAFAQAGIDLALIGRSSEKLEMVATAAKTFGVQAAIYQLDLSQVAQVNPKITEIIADFGRVDILVNNAGMAHTGELFTTPLHHWQQAIDLNLTSVFQTIQAILPGMRDRRQGTIINIASIAGHEAFPGWGAYSVSKAGLIALSKTLAAEERSHGIRVMTISPGAVNTPLWDTDTVTADFDRSRMLTSDIVAQTILQAVLLPEQAMIQELILMPSAGAL